MNTKKRHVWPPFGPSTTRLLARQRVAIACRVLALLIAGSAINCTLAQSGPPNSKGLCCQGPLFGVHDLSGSWQGFSEHAPRVGSFGGSEFLYEGTELTGRITSSIKLVDQQLFPRLETGGRRVVQTYTGKGVVSWWEFPNSSSECLPIPQQTNAMCGYERKFATYQLDFNLVWCEARDGFVLRGADSYDQTLIESNSGLPILSRLFYSPRNFECTTVDIRSATLTLDHEGDLLALLPLPVVRPALADPPGFDIVEYTVGDRFGCWCEAGGTNTPRAGIGKKIGPPDLAELTDDVRFTVTTQAPLDLVDPEFKPRGSFQLQRQLGPVRNRLFGEDEASWQAYLAAVQDRLKTVDVSPQFADGEFVFADLPLYEVVDVDGQQVPRPARYAIRLSEINVEERVAGVGTEETKTTMFTAGNSFNLRPGEIARFDVEPVDEIPIKRALIEELSLKSIDNYLPAENLALAHLNALSANITPAQLEGLKRAILAERAVRDSANFSEQMIEATLGGLGDLLANLIDAGFSKLGDGKSIKEKKQRLGNLKEALNPGTLIEDGWNPLGNDREAVESAIEQLLNENADLKLAVVAEKLKKLVGYATAGLKSALIQAGLSPDTAEVVARVVDDVLNTAFDAMITQGVGAAKVAAQEAVKLAVASAKDELFDTFDFSFTALTKPTLDYSSTEFEAWSVDNLSQFKSDQNLARNSLVTLGIDANAILGEAKSSSIWANGFASAESVFGSLSKVTRYAKLGEVVAKIGKYVNGIRSFAVPLRGAFEHMPRHADVGVARAYGKNPSIIFPEAAVSPIGSSLSQPLAAVGTDTVQARLDDALDVLDSAMTLQSQAWQADALDDLLELLTGANALSRLLDEIDQASADVLSLAAAVRDPNTVSTQAADAMVRSILSVDVQFAELLARQSELLFAVLSGEFTSPADPLYLVNRNEILKHIERAKNATEGLRFGLQFFSDTSRFLSFDSPVRIGDIQVTSAISGGPTVSTSGEQITLTARVKNLGGQPVSGVQIGLSVPINSAAITLLDAAVITVGSGDLQPNDGFVGTGNDEAEVSWQLRYDGAVDDELAIALALETSSTAVGDPGRYGTSYGFVSVDGDAFDPDVDGMPSAWEASFGLDPTVADDEMDPDGDGLPNGREYEERTNPQQADTDMDGLNDSQEVNGHNGWVSDPNAADTDGDSSNDSLDGAPLDPLSTDPAVAPEPIIALPTATIALNEGTPLDRIKISNLGSGPLLWSTTTTPPGIVSTGPVDGAVQSGAYLSLSLMPGLDVTALEGQQIRVIVTDAFGSVADQQEIIVVVGELGDSMFIDGFETPLGAQL